MKQQSVLLMSFCLVLFSCNILKNNIKDANPEKLTIPDYNNNLTDLVYYWRHKNFQPLKYLVKVDFQDTASGNSISDLRYGWWVNSVEPLNYYEEQQKARIDSSIKFVQIEPSTNMPAKFKNYMLDTNNSFTLGYFKIIDSIGEAIRLPITNTDGIKNFDHPLENNFNSTLYLFRAPVYDNCTTFHNLNGNKAICGSLNNYKCLIFNPLIINYRSAINDLWNIDYTYYIHCNFISISLESLGLKNTSKYHRFRDETQLTKKEANEYARLFVNNKKKILHYRVTAFKNFIIEDFNNNQAKLYVSYFELVLWQVYRPSNFEKGKLEEDVATLYFNSNNPDYPGNYEVKFNIYKPYNYKVFKR
jgi:hypothetical protein